MIISTVPDFLWNAQFRYAAGTTPWGNPSSSLSSTFEPQRHDDGYLEVIGFTAASLVSRNGEMYKLLTA